MTTCERDLFQNKGDGSEDSGHSSEHGPKFRVVAVCLMLKDDASHRRTNDDHDGDPLHDNVSHTFDWEEPCEL